MVRISTWVDLNPTPEEVAAARPIIEPLMPGFPQSTYDALIVDIFERVAGAMAWRRTHKNRRLGHGTLLGEEIKPILARVRKNGNVDAEIIGKALGLPAPLSKQHRVAIGYAVQKIGGWWRYRFPDGKHVFVRKGEIPINPDGFTTYRGKHSRGKKILVPGKMRKPKGGG